MNDTPEQAKQKVIDWLDKVVIAENFCPFAKAPRLENTIRLSVFEDENIQRLSTKLSTECQQMDVDEGIETTLLVCVNGFYDFYDYLDALNILQTQMTELHYDGVYQLASFHPQYIFDGEPYDATSHYTNRAPYPIFHILRETSITKALASFSKPENIPVRNIAHTKTLGVEFFKQYLK